jgi:hypothetical protein
MKFAQTNELDELDGAGKGLSFRLRSPHRSMLARHR